MTIYILALHGVVTGGPEATHQLSDALIEQGFDARIVYFQWNDIWRQVQTEDGRVLGVEWLNPPQFPEYVGYAEEYARYKAKLARTIPDEEGAVVVLPETAAPLAASFKRAKVLVWWLSVDNAFGCLSVRGNFALNDMGNLAPFNLNHLRKPNVYHASQSRYAAGFCEALGFNHVGMLSDYTIDLTEYADPIPMAERPKLVAFNARPDKVIANLEAIEQEIAKLDPDIRCVGVHGMKRNEIAALFAAARVYVDLGNFPGKDRLPREATSMGCMPIVLRAGAGDETDGFSLWVTATARQIAGIVIQTIMGQAGIMYEPATPRGERDTFNTEVRDVFSQL